MKLFKTITKCFRTHAIFLRAGCTKDVLLFLRFFAITENLMTKRSFIFRIYHEQKEKKIMVINILLSFSVFSSHA